MSKSKTENSHQDDQPHPDQGLAAVSSYHKEVIESANWTWLKVAAISMTMLWLSFPPIGLWWLGWIALVPLVWLMLKTSQVSVGEAGGKTARKTESAVSQEGSTRRKPLLRGRPYRQLYFVGLLYWLGTFYFIPIPHPALWVGWVALSAYMAIYTPLFVAISRAMTQRLKIPALVAIPITWTGIEWIRSHFATGMALVCLSHTQYRQPIMIQVADLSGGYTLTFAMMIFATGTAMMTAGFSRRFLGVWSETVESEPKLNFRFISVVIPIVSLTSVLMYGQFRLNERIVLKNESVAKIALIQSSHDVVFSGMTMDDYDDQFDDRYRLTHQARTLWPELDLVVWPESAFGPYLDLTSDFAEADLSVKQVSNVQTQLWSNAIGFPDRFPTPVPLLTGAGTYDPIAKSSYASAILIDKKGAVSKRYYKNHLVMIGEYVPLIESLPLPESFRKMAPTTTAGTRFEIIQINGVNIAPNICFESTVPHFIRRQINELSDAGTEPDVMVNMTNDGWFFGTSCLDLHLACNVFRAVEMRKPNLVCANTGFSAEIDSSGRLVQLGPRRSEKALMAEVKPESRSSLYRTIGGIVPAVFGWAVVILGIGGWWTRKH